MILCADDYGLNLETNLAILELVALGRITSVSVMTTHSSPQDINALKKYRDQIDIGLHLNFSEPFSLNTLLNSKILRRSIRNQIELFKKGFGFEPDYIDGHQHLHQLPQVARALRHVLLDMRFSPKYIRISRPTKTQKSIKSILIGTFGNISARILKNHTLLSEVYGHMSASDLQKPFKESFANALPENPPANSLFYCHPSKSLNTETPYTRHCKDSFEFLCSEKFVDKNRFKPELRSY